ncbi:MAG TPA: nucleotidyltransferase family protein [Bacteroidia bacterium]|jgi:D-glycero-alpha-D-manno-heptose 1-phosphate guanylyltransferase|nr:nucleotidyltransferase family protein [Bacteroidia bacterium]
MIKEAIILAGGLGTRLRSVVSDLPKSMADVNGKPFLHYLLLRCKKYGVEKVVLSVGYMAEKVEAYFGNEYLGIKIEYAHEKEALGTGGGIRLAMEKCSGAHVLAMNGDSFFNVPLDEFSEKHLAGSSDATLALRKVEDASRYGTVALDGSRIISFREKDANAKGSAFINGGVYALRRKTFLANTEAGKNFSIEYDFFGKLADKLWLQSFPCDGYFIDIGVPEDYEKAQKDFATDFTPSTRGTDFFK